jgi:hypothetical protein
MARGGYTWSMRRGALVAVLLAALVWAASAQAAQPSSGVRGTVLDTTCASGCQAECPPPPVCRGPHACTGRLIVCPLNRSPLICTQAGCPGPPIVRYPLYEGTAATVLVRRAGAAKPLMRVPVNGGHFDARLAPGRYVLRAVVGEPCWTGTRQTVKVEAGRFGAATLEVSDGCVAHPDARR